MQNFWLCAILPKHCIGGQDDFNLVGGFCRTYFGHQNNIDGVDAYLRRLYNSFRHQHGEEDGLGAISGQTETQDSFYGKNKSKRKESRLKLWTMICGIVIAVLSIAWFVVELLV